MGGVQNLSTKAAEPSTSCSAHSRSRCGSYTGRGGRAHKEGGGSNTMNMIDSAPPNTACSFSNTHHPSSAAAGGLTSAIYDSNGHDVKFVTVGGLKDKENLPVVKEQVFYSQFIQTEGALNNGGGRNSSGNGVLTVLRSLPAAAHLCDVHPGSQSAADLAGSGSKCESGVGTRPSKADRVPSTKVPLSNVLQPAQHYLQRQTSLPSSTTAQAFENSSDIISTIAPKPVTDSIGSAVGTPQRPNGSVEPASESTGGCSKFSFSNHICESALPSDCLHDDRRGEMQGAQIGEGRQFIPVGSSEAGCATNGVSAAGSTSVRSTDSVTNKAAVGIREVANSALKEALMAGQYNGVYLALGEHCRNANLEVVEEVCKWLMTRKRALKALTTSEATRIQRVMAERQSSICTDFCEWLGFKAEASAKAKGDQRKAKPPEKRKGQADFKDSGALKGGKDETPAQKSATAALQKVLETRDLAKMVDALRLYRDKANKKVVREVQTEVEKKLFGDDGEASSAVSSTNCSTPASTTTTAGASYSAGSQSEVIAENMGSLKPIGPHPASASSAFSHASSMAPLNGSTSTSNPCQSPSQSVPSSSYGPPIPPLSERPSHVCAGEDRLREERPRFTDESDDEVGRNGSGRDRGSKGSSWHNIGEELVQLEEVVARANATLKEAQASGDIQRMRQELESAENKKASSAVRHCLIRALKKKEQKLKAKKAMPVSSDTLSPTDAAKAAKGFAEIQIPTATAATICKEVPQTIRASDEDAGYGVEFTLTLGVGKMRRRHLSCTEDMNQGSKLWLNAESKSRNGEDVVDACVSSSTDVSMPYAEQDNVDMKNEVGNLANDRRASLLDGGVSIKLEHGEGGDTETQTLQMKQVETGKGKGRKGGKSGAKQRHNFEEMKPQLALRDLESSKIVSDDRHSISCAQGIAEKSGTQEKAEVRERALQLGGQKVGVLSLPSMSCSAEGSGALSVEAEGGFAIGGQTNSSHVLANGGDCIHHTETDIKGDNWIKGRSMQRENSTASDTRGDSAAMPAVLAVPLNSTGGKVPRKVIVNGGAAVPIRAGESGEGIISSFSGVGGVNSNTGNCNTFTVSGVGPSSSFRPAGAQVPDPSGQLGLLGPGTGRAQPTSLFSNGIAATGRANSEFGRRDGLDVSQQNPNTFLSTVTTPYVEAEPYRDQRTHNGQSSIPASSTFQHRLPAPWGDRRSPIQTGGYPHDVRLTRNPPKQDLLQGFSREVPQPIVSEGVLRQLGMAESDFSYWSVGPTGSGNRGSSKSHGSAGTPSLFPSSYRNKKGGGKGVGWGGGPPSGLVREAAPYQTGVHMAADDDENDDDDDENLCIICLDREKDTFYDPCEHSFCLDCAIANLEARKLCPICRIELRGYRQCKG